MPPKRRILVAFEGSTLQEGERKRLAISIDEKATIADLAQEVAGTIGEEQVKLEVGDGFELRNQDGIDIILDNDTVVARPHPHALPVSSSIRQEVGLRSPPPTQEKREMNFELGHIKITFITAELARSHARKNLRVNSEPSNGVLAFDGELVSCNTTVAALRQEAARIFQFTTTSDRMEDTVCDHETTSSCSCAIAQEVQQHGLFSTLHCRLTVDGTKCSNNECPYSHVPLKRGTSGQLPPHCSVCDEALGFPCPTCLKTAEGSEMDPSLVIFCPLVQNAGCGHLHHSHCLGVRNDSTVVGCPSGCSVTTVHRESLSFDPDLANPYIIVAWDGDKINKVPVPQFSNSDQLQSMTTTAVLTLVEEFLISMSFHLEGLSVRIHSRDASMETVTFCRSTLVSVCPSASHVNLDHRRFPLFSEKVPSKSASSHNSCDFVDLHTRDSPILVCGCTRLKDLYPSIELLSTPLTLYVVKRRCEVSGDTAGSKHVGLSKQSTYLADAAWQPMVKQTVRGMAALLSSLYLLAASAARKGLAAENNVLSALYAITRFPPAVRALGILLLNVTPQPQEKAALSEALYNALKDFSANGPEQIIRDSGRLFETSRILMAHILTAADVSPSAEVATRALESVSLMCAVSHKRLTDPVLLNPSSLIVERGVASLLVAGGDLYRPSLVSGSEPTMEAVEKTLYELLSRTVEFRPSSIHILYLEKLRTTLPTWSPSLEGAGRDFIVAIKRANQTDLVSRGPLELKSAEVIPPQIVLDGEGLLAVFTGRGCGSTRDVNFFRPTCGGDTEVDVNDVGYTLEKVIAIRKSEDTWQVDSFGGVPVKSRTPDEAIIMCLDLSESMSQRSAVSDSRLRSLQEEEEEFDPETEAETVTKRMLNGYSKSFILDKATQYLKTQHSSCHEAWKSSVLTDLTLSRLIEHLGIMAYRDVLCHDLSTSESGKHLPNHILMLACFASASTDQSKALETCLETLFHDLDVSKQVMGVEPFDVPRRLLDPLTGDLVKPAPSGSNPRASFFGLLTRSTVTLWTSGFDVLQTVESNNTIEVALHHGDTITKWKLPKTAHTRILYKLANRATHAKYSSFSLRPLNSMVQIPDSTHLTLGSTVLGIGGAIEIHRGVVHSRRPQVITVGFKNSAVTQTIMLPANASILALLSHIRAPDGGRLSDIMLWHGLQKAGDGVRRGKIVKTQGSIQQFATSFSISFECHPWFWSSIGSQKSREESRHLSRLDLLKELFNVFLNRASSFDTSVSLVLGLVTFADQAVIKHELTPLFESFRVALDEVSARGDTAVYDALDVARSSLNQFRQDIPSLRRRIIIVSDGDDTSSKNMPTNVCAALQRDGIIVDSVQVGYSHNRILHAISVATGGYRFSPRTSLGDALSIFDLETMLFSGERPPESTKGRVTSAWQLQQYGNASVYPIDAITIDQFPRRAEHPKLRETARDVSKSVGVSQSTNERLRRIMRELQGLVQDPHPQIDAYVNDEDMSFLKVIIEAPSDIENCPYKGGCFLLTCDLPAQYPRDPPEVRFVTFILHPNVSKQGKVCVAELGRLWTSDITLKEILTLVYGLLLEPDLENPLEIQASLKYYDDDGTYALAAANAVCEHASKNREAWRRELET